MMKLAISEIRLDGNTQPRCSLDTETVTQYAESMRNGDAFPPVVIFNDGDVNWIGDGSHRIYAALSIGRSDIDADVRPGTRIDALRYALTANDRHGLRPTNADKRRGVGLVLDCEELAGLSNRQVADIAGVTEGFVRKIKKERGAYCTHPEGSGLQTGVKWDNRLLDDLEPGQTLMGHHDGDGNAVNIFIRRASSPDENYPCFDYGLLGVEINDRGDDGNDTWIRDGMNQQGKCGIIRRMTTMYEYEFGPLLWDIISGDAYGVIFDSFYENHNITADERWIEAMRDEAAMMRKHGCAVTVKTA